MIHAQMLPDIKPFIREWDGTPLYAVQLCWQHDDAETAQFVHRLWHMHTQRDREMSLQLDGRKP